MHSLARSLPLPAAAQTGISVESMSSPTRCEDSMVSALAEMAGFAFHPLGVVLRSVFITFKLEGAAWLERVVFDCLGHLFVQHIRNEC